MSNVVCNAEKGEGGVLAWMEGEETRTIFTYICRLLSERAAVMVAVPIATFLNR